MLLGQYYIWKVHGVDTLLSNIKRRSLFLSIIPNEQLRSSVLLFGRMCTILCEGHTQRTTVIVPRSTYFATSHRNYLLGSIREVSMYILCLNQFLCIWISVCVLYPTTFFTLWRIVCFTDDVYNLYFSSVSPSTHY